MKARALSEAQFAAIVDLLRARTGLAFGPSRRQQAESGIRQAMAETGVADLSRFAQLLHGNDRVFQALIEQLTVAETYFFREREQFEVLRRNVLPDLQRRRDGRIRIWSAGCASGEEAYSLAMLLDREGLGERASIVATDISRVALARARKASYGAWSFRDNPPEIAEQYFQRHGDRLVLIERVRQMVEFDVFNLASDIYPSRITGSCGLDVILCRNVLIYFDADTVARVAKQMFASLKDGGWLIAGPSDPPLWQYAPYETVLTTAGVFYRRVRVPDESRKGSASVKPPAPRHRTRAEGRGGLPSDVEPASGLPIVAPPAQRRPADDERVRLRRALDNRMSELAALANLGDPGRVSAAVSAALAAHPMSAEIHYLHAIVLMGCGRYEEAASSLRRALYLDRSMAIAHFALGSVHARRGAVEEARRSYRNVLSVCDERRADEIVPFSEGERTGSLVEAARAQLDNIRVGTGRRA